MVSTLSLAQKADGTWTAKWGASDLSNVKFDGQKLSFVRTMKFGDNEFSMSDKWTLSEDGKTLTIARTFKSAMGEGGQKLVLEKQ